MTTKTGRHKRLRLLFIAASGLGAVAWSIYRGAYWLAAVLLLLLLCSIFARALLKIYSRVLTCMFELSRGSFDREIFTAVDPRPSHDNNSHSQPADLLLTRLNEQQAFNQELTAMNQRLEKLLKERTVALEQANMARRQLLANISHDLRTPLTSIQGYVEAMLDGVITDPEEKTKYLNLIYTKALVLNRLIKELFDLSHLEARQVPLKLRLVTPEELISQVCEKYQEDVKMAGLNLMATTKPEVQPSEVKLTADTDYIERVYANLIFNSIRHTPPGGTIQLSLLPVTATDDSITLTVRDSGEGIQQEQVPFIFDRYYQGTHPSDKTKNSGLGLNIAKEIIAAHGGHIWAESQPGAGMAIYFTLPVAN